MPPGDTEPSIAAASSGPTLRRLAENCLLLFRQCRWAAGSTAKSTAWLENAQGRFRWWSFGLNVQKPGRSSLDHKLSYHNGVRGTVSNLLLALAASLTEYRTAAQNPTHLLNDSNRDRDQSFSDASSSISSEGDLASDVSDSDSDAGRHRPGRSSLAIHVMYIEQCLDQLDRLSVLIRRAGDRHRHRRADQDLAKVERTQPELYEEFRTYLETIILFGPMECALLAHLDLAASRREIPTGVAVVLRWWLRSRLNPLQQRLVQANVVRRHRILYSRGKGRPSTVEPTEPRPVHRQIANIRLDAPRQSPPGLDIAAAVPSALVAPPLPPTEHLHSAGRPSQAGTATVLDRDLDARVVSKSARASSVMSKLTRTGQKQDYPNRSVLKTSRQCPYCGFLLEDGYITNDNKWQ